MDADIFLFHIVISLYQGLRLTSANLSGTSVAFYFMV